MERSNEKAPQVPALGPKDEGVERSDYRAADAERPTLSFEVARGPVVTVVAPTEGFEPHVRLTEAELDALLSTHDVRKAKDGPYICVHPMGDDGRRSDANALPGTLLALDLDDLRPGAEKRLETWLKDSGFWARVYSTWSHTRAKPKLRVYLRLDEPLTGEQHRWLYLTLIEEKAFPFKLDGALAKPSQPSYLPSCPPEHAADTYTFACEGKPFEFSRYRAVVDARARDARTHYEGYGTGVRVPGGTVDRFNESYQREETLRELLERHGYERKGSRYLAPGSQSGNAAVLILGDHVVSYHDPAHDPLAQDGESGKRLLLDPFAAWCALEHRNDFKSAFRAADEFLQGEAEDEESREVVPMRPEAFTGFVGDFVRFVVGDDRKASEASAEAVLVQLLAATGCCFNRRMYRQVGGDKHFALLFGLMLGASARARKGMSMGYVRALFRDAVERTFQHRIVGGAGSGQGIIYHVRDAKYGRDDKGAKVTLDPGVDDKRLLIWTGEFAALLAAMRGETSTLSQTLRMCWDLLPIATAIRDKGGAQGGGDACATPYVAVLGHCTVDEFTERIKAVDEANGLLNRFLLVYQPNASTLHADGGTKCAGPSWDALVKRFNRIEAFWRSVGREVEAEFAPDAWAAYERFYETYRQAPIASRLANVTNRLDANVLRLSLAYAQLDVAENYLAARDAYEEEVAQRPVDQQVSAPQMPPVQTFRVEITHVRAAIAVAAYASASAKFIFGNKGTAAEEILLDVLRAHDGPMPWTKARRAATAGHGNKDDFERTVVGLAAYGRIEIITTPREGGGRPLRTLKLLR